MPQLLKLDWGNWLYGLFAGFIGGGAGAVVTGVTASMLVPDKLAVGSTKSFELIGVVFLVHGCISMAMFLQQNPLPKQIKVVDESASVTSTEGGKVTMMATKTTTTVTDTAAPSAVPGAEKQ
jgi:hypothetical protein